MRASALTLALSLVATAAVAQQAPSKAPPQLEQIEEVDNPITVTTKPGSDKQVQEKREGGRITESTVKSGKSVYTVNHRPPAGTAMPGDTMGQAIRGPAWTVMEFDIAAKKKKRSAENAAAEDAAEAPPPPPAAPASK
ncbi:hypothetical protein AB4Z19_13495 [Pseudoduganella sp. RAF19]|uniref:hypothetical protein n=1 Tax=Pseudoduganella sp. RAF19 TaxID=3233052 RepID=UPI003F9D8673